MTDDELTEKIIGCSYKVHNSLGPGFLEKVYENALRIELEKLGLNVKQQEPISVLYDGHIVGEYYADLLIEQRVVVEVKAVQTLAKRTRSTARELLDSHSHRRRAFDKLRIISAGKAQVQGVQTDSDTRHCYPAVEISLKRSRHRQSISIL
jgi:GxxExxY protein